MRLEPAYPFLDYACYKNWHAGMGRFQVCMVLKTDRTKRRTVTYAKYLLSVHLGRALQKHEEVDHIDGDKTNDTLSNLQVLTKAQHHKKSGSECQGAGVVDLVCPECNEEFQLSNRHYKQRMKVRDRVFCSRLCSGAYNGRRNYGRKG